MMKTVKLSHKFIEPLLKGEKVSTWRMFDDKDLTAGEVVKIIDKVDPNRPETWKGVGVAHIDKVVEKLPQDLTTQELAEHNYASLEEMIEAFREYYPYKEVTVTTPLKILYFTFSEVPESDK